MSDYCPSCGVAYTEHLGLIGTCRELMEAREAVKTVSRASNEYLRQVVVLREALERIADSSNWFHTSDEKGGPFTAWRGEGEPDILAEQALQQAGGGE